MPQEFTNGNMRITVIDVAVNTTVDHLCLKSCMDLEIENTSVIPAFFGRTSNVTDATGYPLKPMSAAAAYDGGIYKTTKYNGRLSFHNPAAAAGPFQVRILEVG